MILTFATLGVNPSDYNAMPYVHAHALIVNAACEWVLLNMLHTNPVHMRNEPYFFGDMDNAFTNFITGTVYLPTVWDAPPANVSMDEWTNPNLLH